MTTIHLQTSIVRSAWRLERLEMVLEGVAGVLRVAAVGSIGLVSVLFDETRASVASIVRALRAAGFEAHVRT